MNRNSAIEGRHGVVGGGVNQYHWAAQIIVCPISDGTSPPIHGQIRMAAQKNKPACLPRMGSNQTRNTMARQTIPNAQPYRMKRCLLVSNALPFDESVVLIERA